MSEPPYNLVAVFADADAKALIEQLIERGQERACISQFRWRSIRDARRDAFRADPVSVVRPFIGFAGCRFLLSWDHWGSGRDSEPIIDVEEEVVEMLRRTGIAEERVEAVAYEPELEHLIAPTWPRVKQILADLRSTQPPSDEDIFANAANRARTRRQPYPESFENALSRRPKSLLRSLIRLLSLRPSSNLFERLGRELSIPDIKYDTQASRISSRLEEWFPTTEPIVN